MGMLYSLMGLDLLIHLLIIIAPLIPISSTEGGTIKLSGIYM